MIVLQPADFNVKGYIIPNAEKISTTLIPYIALKTEEILRRTLGHTMYEQLVAGADASVQQWVDVRDGKTYTVGSTAHRWVGLKLALRPYICAMWLYEDTHNVTANGVSVAKVENSEAVDPIYKIVSWYNEFVRHMGNTCTREDCLYGLLKSDTVLYASLVWKNPKPLNVFGL